MDLADPSCFLGLSPVERLQQLYIAVTGGGGGTFSIEAVPSSLSLDSGESGDILITLTLVSGSPEMATLTAPDLLVGWTASFSANPISTDGGTSTMTLTAP